MSPGDWIGITSGVLIGVVTALWFRRISAVDVPRFRAPYFATMIIAAVMGIAAFMLDTGWVGGVPAGFAILLGFMFPALRLQSSQDVNVPNVEIGQPILSFAALDDDGDSFDLATMNGLPYLLKFFRGHW